MAKKKPKDKKSQIKFLYNFIKDHKLAVMATVTKNALPEAALIGIAVAEDLSLICSTFASSRKYVNLKKNRAVALVIGWEKAKTVQYEGAARELPQDEAEVVLKTFLAKTPAIAKSLRLEHRVLYLISPKWVRFSDLSTEPWERFEVKF